MSTAVQRSNRIMHDLKVSMELEELCDICLLGTDGIGIPASRFMLSTRSLVFRRMLFGEFKESDSSVAHLHFTSETIQRVVHYCYTDAVKIPIMEDIMEDVKEDADTQVLNDLLEEENGFVWNENLAREMIRLRSAADFFELPGLRESVIQTVCSFLVKHPALSCAVLDELSALKQNDAILTAAALKVIRQQPKKALLPEAKVQGRGILACSESVIKKVLTSDAIGSGHDFLIAKCLVMWLNDIEPSYASGREDASTKEAAREDSDISSSPCRFQVAKQVANDVHLNLISPSDLVTLTPSRLFTKDQLFEAFKAHALLAQKKANIRRILVSKAGTPEVNGVYAEYGTDCYCRKGEWKNKQATFLLIPTVGGGTLLRVSVKQNEQTKETTLYFTRNASLNGIPSDKNWRIFQVASRASKGRTFHQDQATHPPPEVTFIPEK